MTLLRSLTSIHQLQKPEAVPTLSQSSAWEKHREKLSILPLLFAFDLRGIPWR